MKYPKMKYPHVVRTGYTVTKETEEMSEATRHAIALEELKDLQHLLWRRIRAMAPPEMNNLLDGYSACHC